MPSSLGRLVLPATYAVGLDVEAEVSESLNVVEPDGSDEPVVCEADDRIAWREASDGSPSMLLE